jgi:hypothetical protein
MKIGIISDTHDNIPKIEGAVELFNGEGVELVLHAGDFISPFTAKPFSRLRCKLIGVFGNNDGEKFGLRAKFDGIGEIAEDSHEVEIAGRRILLIHKDGLVEPIAEGGRYDLVVYGHTHEPDIRKIGRTLVVNSGEACGWLSGRSTVAILDLDSMEAELKEI